MTSVGPGPHRPRPRDLISKADDLISIALTTAISVSALVYMAFPRVVVLVAWQAIAVVYLVLDFTTFRNRRTRDVPSSSRALPGAVLENLTWVLPIAASGTGIASAVRLLTADGGSGAGDASAWVAGVLGSVGVVVAWLLLQSGFAEIYESVYERLPEASMIDFPGIEGEPTLSDFLYLSFTVGTSFGVSGVTIASRKVRRVILVHSVTSFFYNAFLVAIAVEVIQGTIASR